MEFKIYKANQKAKFYRSLERTPPKGVIDLSTMVIDLESPHKEDVQALFTGLISIGDIAMIYGQAGLGKTQLAHSMMYALAAGKDLNARHQFAASKPLSVLMVTGEMRTDQLHIRDSWFKAMYPATSKSSFIKMCRFDQNLADPEGQRTLDELITHINQENLGKRNIDVVILDSLKTLTYCGDSAKNWNDLFAYLAKARDKRGLTFIIIHHTNKAGEQFFGSVDIDVKLDLIIHLSKQVPNLKGQLAGLGLSDSQLKQYTNFLAAELRKKFSGDYHDAIRFFFSIAKGRSLKNSDKNTLLMSFLPDKASLGWQVDDIFSPKSAWSPEQWQQQRGYTCQEANPSLNVNQTQKPEDAPVPEQGDLPTHAQLKKMSKEKLIANLKLAVQAGCSSRVKLGQYFGITLGRKAKDTIDYLMKKHNIKNEELGILKP